MMSNCLTVAVASIIASFSTSAYAGENRLIHASGAVTIGGKPAQSGDPVPLEKTVRTDSGAVAIISAKGGAVRLKLDPGSTIKLNTRKNDMKKSDPALEAELEFGGVIADVKSAAGKKQMFRIRSRSAVMGVRGTRFYAALSGSGGKPEDVWMCVDEGEVEISDLTTGGAVLVKAGLGVQLPSKGKISEPKPYEWTKKLNWNMDPDSGTVKNEVKWHSVYGDPLMQLYD